jgi:hypothetical protein
VVGVVAASYIDGGGDGGGYTRGGKGRIAIFCYLKNLGFYNHRLGALRIVRIFQGGIYEMLYTDIFTDIILCNE